MPRKLPAGAEATTRSCLIALGIRGADLDALCQAVFAVAARHDIEPPKAWLHETARKQVANFRRLYRHKFEVLDPGAGALARELGVSRSRMHKRLRRALARFVQELCA